MSERMDGIWSAAKPERDPAAIDRLRTAARRDLEMLNFPAPNWVPTSCSADGRPVLDVLIIGGGMCGQTAAFALMRAGIRNFRIVDKAARGEEGPWGTYARMEILRSPKQLTGPDLGVPSLTFRAWYESGCGEAAWHSLHKAGRIDWRDYLLFVRDTVGIPVENGVEVAVIRPAGRLIEVEASSAVGQERLLARHVVLATGRDGSGGQRLPVIAGLDWQSPARRGRISHSAEEIDFASLRGKRVAVLGAGASAFDCAAAALEAGAGAVVLYCRRAQLPQINKSKGASFPGFLRGVAALDDATRWKFFSYIFSEQVPPPYESVLRCDSHENFSIAFGQGWRSIRLGRTEVFIDVGGEGTSVDAAILATGFDVDLTLNGLLSPHAGEIALWRDRVPPDSAADHEETSRFPYLGAAFALQPAPHSKATWLGNVHIFNWGATVSQGPLSGDIPGLAIGAERLASDLAARLLDADIARHW
ncbi:MAG TPA: NAD(P)/FAD-dependent oxidoreductase, partial [Hyphomicrobiaceae bacterium]|nr:NAD(P)/FAD-dependent oxidoreductase [Hyphomicrobiaceae bacterium]